MVVPIPTFIKAPKVARRRIFFTVQYVLTGVKIWNRICVSGRKSETVGQRKVRVHTLVQLTGRHMYAWELQIPKIPVVYARQ